MRNKILHTHSFPRIIKDKQRIKHLRRSCGMEKQEKEEFPFIREKIKEKPINKKRLARHGLHTVFFASLFGLTACFAFTLAQPFMESWLHPKNDPAIRIPDDEWASEAEPSSAEGFPAEEGTQEAEPGTEAAAVKEFEPSDYQMLQNKIYAIGKEANRAVVTVTGVVSNTDWYNNSFESNGQASGVIIGESGNKLLILTEHKVVQPAEEIHVTFIDDAMAKASLRKYDGNTGIAILTVDLKQLGAKTRERISCAKLGNSLNVSQGNIAIAVGSPLGTNYSIGTGNVTSVGNVIETMDHTYSVFTTDIVGNSNSSGVLLNLEGEVIGLVMQDYNANGGNNTLTAISISELKKVIEMLSNGRDIPYLGLKVVTVTDKIALEHKIPRGVYIKEVALDSPALAAGLQNGDVIVEMDGDEIYAIDAFETKALSLKPGDEVEIAVSRQGMDERFRVDCKVMAGTLW